MTERWSIRREVVIAAPVAAVWRHVANSELTSRWWCPPPTVDITFDQHEGARFQERYDDGDHRYEIHGTVVAFVPEQHLAIRRTTERAAAPADLIEISLAGEGGHTRVTLEHSFLELPADRRSDMDEFYAAGWESSLQLLTEMVEADPC